MEETIEYTATVTLTTDGYSTPQAMRDNLAQYIRDTSNNLRMQYDSGVVVVGTITTSEGTTDL